MPEGPIAATAIHALDDQTVEQIAAGEVVERPASAVKELVENSLDADATRIDIEVDAGGTDGIRVADDGVGMTRRGAEKAVKQHTTSKLRDIKDLSAGPVSLGFRGEALYTISAVSRLTITTRPHDEAETGTCIQIAGGEVESVDPAGCPPGTTVEVADLFYNTPARRAFLRATTTEFDHVNRVVANYALANPDVAISLVHDGNEVFATPGQGDLRGAVLAVYGRDVATGMLDVDSEFTDAPVERIHGLVSEPETTRSRPRYVSTFVNGRYVNSTRLREGIVEAYAGQLATDRYPFAVLFCEVPPESIDVNVHPRKMEIRFEEAEAVVDCVNEAVESTLLDAGMIRTTAPRGTGAPAETEIAPGESAPAPASRDDPTRGGGTTPSGSTPSARPQRDTDSRPAIEPDRKFRRGIQRSFTGELPQPELTSLPPLEVLGQLADTYIVAEGPDGLVLIDQHAADERINFERLRTAFRDNPESQQLVSPVELSLTADESDAFPAVREALATLGFHADLTGDRTLQVRAVPTILDDTVEPERIRDAVGSAVRSAEPGEPIDDVAMGILGDMACYPAVTGHTPLAEGSVVELLETLDACENPYACPHGRPVIVRIDETELEDRFERDYPGHGDRRAE